MVRKSRSYRKVKTKNRVKYKVRKVGRKRCDTCFKILNGVPNVINSKHYGLSKSLRGPSRMFGGSLCSSCSRDLIFERVKLMVNKDG